MARIILKNQRALEPLIAEVDALWENRRDDLVGGALPENDAQCQAFDRIGNAIKEARGQALPFEIEIFDADLDAAQTAIGNATNDPDGSVQADDLEIDEPPSPGPG